MLWRSVFTLIGLGGWLASNEGASALHNVILMIGDDHGLQVGCYGDPTVKTPNMDRLAANGTRFANAFSAVSSCSPSRSVIMSGMFNHSTGQYGLAHATHNFHSLKSTPSVSKILGEAGYRTAILGKYHVEPPEVYPFKQHLECPGGPRNVARMAEAARSFMAAESEKPFFLLVGYTDPHRAQEGFANQANYNGVRKIEYDPGKMIVPPWLPDNAEVRADLADYYQSISRLDQGIGLMLDTLKTTGHDRDTLVIYVSDNGPPFPGAKTTLYEPGIHLPLIVSSPAQDRRSVTSQAMVSLADIAPTILEWTGQKVPEQVAGRSLLPILNVDNPADRDVVFGSHTFHEVTMYYPMRMIRTREFKYILNLANTLEYPFASDLWHSPTWQSVLRRGDKLYGKRTVAAYLHRPHEELYDLRTDPDEIRNEADNPAYAETLRDLRDRLKTWQKKTQDPWIIKYEHE